MHDRRSKKLVFQKFLMICWEKEMSTKWIKASTTYQQLSFLTFPMSETLVRATIMSSVSLTMVIAKSSFLRLLVFQFWYHWALLNVVDWKPRWALSREALQIQLWISLLKYRFLPSKVHGNYCCTSWYVNIRILTLCTRTVRVHVRKYVI